MALSQIYLKGFDDGSKSADQEAFDAYTHFAKQMHHETYKKPAHDDSVWAVIDGGK